MIVRRAYVCDYCGSPHVSYREIVEIEGIALDETDPGKSILEFRDYEDDSEYCRDCHNETHTVEAFLFFHGDKLYEIVEDLNTSTFRIFEVPFEKEGLCLYFNGQPKLLFRGIKNEITDSLLQMLYGCNAAEEKRGLALQTLLRFAEQQPDGRKESV